MSVSLNGRSLVISGLIASEPISDSITVWLSVATAISPADARMLVNWILVLVP